MSTLAEILAADRAHVWHPYTPMDEWRARHDPLVVARAEGPWLELANGERLLDGNASWWVSTLGHNHPRLVAALKEQADRLCHVALAGITHEPAALLARELAAVAPAGLDQVFYSDDGSTAVEVAVKIALQFCAQSGRPRRRRFLALDGAFHGETLGATSLGGVEVFRGRSPAWCSTAFTCPRPRATTARARPVGRGVRRRRRADRARARDDRRRGARADRPGRRRDAHLRPAYLRACATLHASTTCSSSSTRSSPATAAPARCGRAICRIVARPDVHRQGLHRRHAADGGDAHDRARASGLPRRRARAFLYGHTYCGNPLGAAVAREVLAIYRDEPIVAGVAAVHDAIVALGGGCRGRGRRGSFAIFGRSARSAPSSSPANPARRRAFPPSRPPTISGTRRRSAGACTTRLATAARISARSATSCT